MRSFRLLSLAICAVLAAVSPSIAASGHITIEKEGVGKDGISISDIGFSGEGGKLFVATLKNDLERSGWFTVVPPVGARVRVAGSANGNANLSVSWDGGRFPWSENSATDRDSIRRAAHRACDEIIRRVLGKRGIAGTRVTFVGKTNGKSDIYLCDADGQSAKRLTQDGAICISPKWTPDGTSIFFTSYRTGSPYIYRTPATGGRIQRLANFSGLNAGGTASPDGRLMALILSISGNPELYVLNLMSGNLTRLTRTPRAVESSPTWSPDGNAIAYVSDESRSPQIYVINVNDRTPRRVTFRGSENVAPDWGPDGRIAYCTKQGGYQVAVYDPKAGTHRVITSGAQHEDPSWAPDARHIACSEGQNGARRIVIIDDPEPSLDIKPDPQVTLFANSGDWTAPDWSER